MNEETTQRHASAWSVYLPPPGLPGGLAASALLASEGADFRRWRFRLQYTTARQ